MNRVEVFSRNVIGACSDNAVLPKNTRTLRDLASYDPVDTVALRRNIAGRLLAAGSYTI
jgi:hypothetical protein